MWRLWPPLQQCMFSFKVFITPVVSGRRALCFVVKIEKKLFPFLSSGRLRNVRLYLFVLFQIHRPCLYEHWCAVVLSECEWVPSRSIGARNQVVRRQSHALVCTATLRLRLWRPNQDNQRNGAGPAGRPKVYSTPVFLLGKTKSALFKHFKKKCLVVGKAC